LKFGVLLPQGWKLEYPLDMDPRDQWKTIVNVVMKTDELGYDHIWVYDHFHTRHGPLPGRSMFDAWTLVTALAPITKKVRLGTLVTCNLFRNPAYLAKISSIVDVISDGRLELGIGAGWDEHEFRAYGYDFPKLRTRVEMLEEAVQIIKLMWTQEDVHFDGKYYKLDGALNSPKPLQKPHPPILIGGGGEKYLLKVVAKYANKWNIPSNYEEYAAKLKILQDRCSLVGRNFHDIVLTWETTTIIDRKEEEVKRKFEGYTADKMGGMKYEVRKNKGLLGAPEEIVEKLKKFEALGIQEVIMYFPCAAEFTELELFRDEVIKKLR